MVKTRKMKVLVVDNETEFASTLAERLQLSRIEAKSVYSGEEALDAVPRFMPDVMVLDMQMPGMSGLDVLSQVKIIDATIEVILLTEHGSFDVGIVGMELGAFGYIVKPVDLTQLMEKITEAYDKRMGA
ncbi:MAG: response regulator [Desulfobulbaceae bacterium]|nr:response regulator [Desulfobulbaceae bacterium]